MPDFSIEDCARKRGFSMICGVDEAGRGPLAGPVCAAAVILPAGMVIDGVNDSKKLSEKKREMLYDIITEKAVAYAVAFSEVDEIEKYNILNATFLAMKRAVCALDPAADYAIIDGNRAPKEIDIPLETVVKGDSRSYSVAAASILAKVTRDRLMYEYDELYPGYGFLNHKGYGTAEHIAAIKKYGPCEFHRPLFIRKFI